MGICLKLYEDYFDDVRKFASEMGQRFTNKCEVELERYECILLPSKKEATLMLMSQNIGITAAAEDLRIRWKDMTNA